MHPGSYSPKTASGAVLSHLLCFSHFLGSFLHTVDTANHLGQGISILEFG